MRRKPIRKGNSARFRRALQHEMTSDLERMVASGLLTMEIIDGEPAYQLTDAGAERLARVRARKH